MSPLPWLRKLALASGKLALFFKKKRDKPYASDRGILIFRNTSDVIAAERVLCKSGFDVEVKGPPPDLQTGCDMVLLFSLLKQAAVEKSLMDAGIMPEKIITEADSLLEPVSIFQIKELGDWLMLRAANMKITIDKRTFVIVNISGGGCPDVPWLAKEMTGQNLYNAPSPISMGHTLCCYSLQKAFEELKRIYPCG